MRKTTNTATVAAIKASKKPTAQAAEDAAPKAERVEAGDDDDVSSIYQEYLNAQQRLLERLKAPSWKRVLAGICASLAVAAGVGWICGFVVEFLTLGVLAVTGSAYAGMVIWVLGVIMMMVAAGKATVATWDAVVSGRLEEAVAPKLSAAKSWLTGKCSSFFGKSGNVEAA